MIHSVSYLVVSRGIFKKLVIVSILASNMGYTVFLFPILSSIYPNKVPSAYNLVAFILIDNVYGVVPAMIIYLIIYICRIDIFKSIAFSIALRYVSL